jgi:hypothetical protein
MGRLLKTGHLIDHPCNPIQCEMLAAVQVFGTRSAIANNGLETMVFIGYATFFWRSKVVRDRQGGAT